MSMPSLNPEETPLVTTEPPAHPSTSSPAEPSLFEGGLVAVEEPVARVDAPENLHAEPARDGWTLVALIPHDGQEPPSDLSDDLARSVWCAVSALWHPSLLARASQLPRIESVDSPSPPGPREIRVIPGGAWERLPSGYRTQAEDARATLLESGTDRAELVRQIQSRLGAASAPEIVENEGMTSSARDFLALGTVQWLVRELTVAMGHADGLDRDSLTRELLSGAHAWQLGDWPSAVNRLRAAFEVLTQARERFYPVDAYLLDMCLLDPAMPAGVLKEPLETPIPITFLAPARAIENQAWHDPQAAAALRQAIADGWADVVGGTYSEAEDSLLPLESILWQFRRGCEVYRAHLDDRNVETYARRRFGLYTQLPQIAKRFGFRYAVHLGFDAGRFPLCPEPKRLWESPDGSNLETLMRPPLAADRPLQGWLLPWRLAATMKNDHVATLALLHWPLPVAPWYIDLRRMATYSPVLGRWTSLNDFFHLTDRPYETFRPEPDSYIAPYLLQAVARKARDPISRLVRQHRLRARLAAAETIHALAQAIGASAAAPGSSTKSEVVDDLPTLANVEERAETDRHDEAETALGRILPIWSEVLASRILNVSTSATSGTKIGSRPGYLVINPVGIPRRAPVVLPDAALDLRPEGPLRAAQFTEEGVYAVVDLPAFGFAWVPKEADLARPPAVAAGLSGRDRRLRNESIEIEVDATTGGLRSVAAASEESPRLGQQLVMTGLVDAQGKPTTSQMRSERFELDYGGPALVQATSSGSLVDPLHGVRLASFVQRYRLWAGRPILEIECALSDLNPTWLERAAKADPWNVYLACRWAWPDSSSMVRRSVLLGPEITESERPETPDFFDISTRKHRIALLFGGLCHHRKQGERMLDTLLIAGLEETRSFTLGVILDQEQPFRASQEWIAPTAVVSTEDGPPAVGATGWLAQIDNKGVFISHVEFAENTNDDRGWGLIFHLLETTGQAARARLRLFRNPTWARQVDFLGETIIDLSLEGDAVRLDLTPHELARIEVTMA
jgi:alpha-mannosidase